MGQHLPDGPHDGQKSGPFEAWQVAGCVLTLAALAVGAAIARWATTALWILPVAFTLAWSIPAASYDDTGLWGVGAIMILIGTLGGAAVLAVGTQWLLEWGHRVG